MSKIKMGVIGLGYWGPNLARNIHTSASCELIGLCDTNQTQLDKVHRLYPNAKCVTSVDELLTLNIDAVAIATPAHTHFPLAKQCLKAGKHVLVEKPLTSTAQEAETLIKLAQEKQCILMVDHTFNYTSAIGKLKQLIHDGELGELLYWDSVRINLGLFQPDVNVIWDLAPHDLSIMDYVLGMQPRAVKAIGSKHFGQKVEDIAYLTLLFDHSFIAHFHCNWLSPVKVRQTLIGGTHKMVVYDDIEATEKIKIYDKGVDVKKTNEGRYETLVQYRTGDMHCPNLKNVEALSVEIEHFADVINNNTPAISSGEAGLNVVKILEAAQRSIEKNGREILL